MKSCNNQECHKAPRGMELFDSKEGRVGQVIPMPVVALYAVYNRLTHSLESCNKNIIQIKQNRTRYLV